MFKNDYPPDWKAISDFTWALAGHRCIRCAHPYRKGEHGKGEWSPCDERCTHAGPLAELLPNQRFIEIQDEAMTAAEARRTSMRLGAIGILAQWRIGTVHHFDGNKANCEWWNLLALCQRCHLSVQARVNPDQPYMFEHSAWLKPYVAGFYAAKYENAPKISRSEVDLRLEELLAYERIA